MSDVTSLTLTSLTQPIDPKLRAVDAIPLIGKSAPFPWEKLADVISRTFECPALAIQGGELQWRNREVVSQGFEPPFYLLNIAIAPLKGTIQCLLSEGDVIQLVERLLTVDAHDLLMRDSDFQTSAKRFLAMEWVYQSAALLPDKELKPTLLSEQSIPSEAALLASLLEEVALCREVSITLDQRQYKARLLLSPTFRAAWVERYAAASTPSKSMKTMAQAIERVLVVEGGSTSLSLAEWQAVQPGDVILLDHCSLTGDLFMHGTVTLTLEGERVAKGQLQEGGVSLSEVSHPLNRKALS